MLLIRVGVTDPKMTSFAGQTVPMLNSVDTLLTGHFHNTLCLMYTMFPPFPSPLIVPPPLPSFVL